LMQQRLRRHARQATWRNVKNAVRGWPDGCDMAVEDVQAMAALVPAVVLLRDRHHLPQCARIAPAGPGGWAAGAA